MTGIIYALLATLCWTFGDFFIQKTSRRIGVVSTFFYLASFGAIILLPFVIGDLKEVLTINNNILLLILGAFVMLFAGLFNFGALKEGKIAVIEPIASFELPITILLAVVIVGDVLGLSDIFLIVGVFIGVLLVATTHHWQLHYHRRWLEKGVLLAGLGAIGMALSNFIVGFGSKSISPIFIIWFIHFSIALILFFYLIYTGQLKKTFNSFRRNILVILAQGIFDNGAWVFYGFATSLLPISIAMTISEGYIALAALLGILVNKEKIKFHQMAGIVIVILGIVFLSISYG